MYLWLIRVSIVIDDDNVQRSVKREKKNQWNNIWIYTNKIKKNGDTYL
jgi:hypothetical protein